MLTFELRPGRGVGPFELGLPICEAIAVVQQHEDTLRQVEIKYSDAPGSTSGDADAPGARELDIVLNFPSYGFHLLFEPETQLLRMVEVYDVTRIQLRYAMSLIGGTTSSASFVNLYERFGPTYAGKYDEERGTYALGYPGLLFHFPIPQKYAADCLSRPGELPLEFPDGTTPVASRLCVFGGTLSDDAGSGSGSGSGGDVQGNGVALANTSLITKGLRYFEEVRVSLGEGGGLRFAGGARIGFGDSPQDVWTQLGAPGDTFHKPLGKMLLHSGAGDAEKGGAATTDYFYNYFTRGIDVLFDGASHRAKKFVLHSNQVGHPDFNVYVKCNFAVEVPADDNGRGGERAEADDMSDEEAFFASTSARADAEAHATANCDGPRIMGLIRADSTFNDVTRLVGDGGRATIHTQFISGSSSNPFGSTFIYGFRQRITLEVMKSGRIANITIF